MIPVQCLRLGVEDASSAATAPTATADDNAPYLVWDMCAAPGAKSSQLLRRMLIHKDGPMQLVCSERSSQRAAMLQKLLIRHHGQAVVDKYVTVLPIDANDLRLDHSVDGVANKTKDPVADAGTSTVASTRLAWETLVMTAKEEASKIANNKKKKSKKQRDEDQAQTQADDQCANKAYKEAVAQRLAKGEAGGVRFDRILLDPPCTGLGLRPRLQMGRHKYADVMESADYQRRLLKTAWQRLKVGGVLSYSTCTLSPAENESNVLWALNSGELPGLRLLEASTQDEIQLHALATQASTHNLLVSPDFWSTWISRHQPSSRKDAINNAFSKPMVWRFGPARFVTAALGNMATTMKTSTCSDVPALCDTTMLTDSVGFFVAIFTKIF